MGYHSHVAIAVSARCAERFLRLLSRLRFKEDVTQDDDGAVLLVTDGKWYAGYPEVEDITSFLGDLDYSDYHLVRVGEEHGDVDESGGFDGFDVHVVTRISFDRGGPVTWPTDVLLKQAVGDDE